MNRRLESVAANFPAPGGPTQVARRAPHHPYDAQPKRAKRPRLNTGDPSQPSPDSTLVSIIHSPPQEIVVTGLTSFTNQVNLASMVAFVMNVSGQPLALYWAEGVVFLADFVEPEALPEEYVKGRIYASNISHAPMAKYNNFVRVGNIEVPVIDVTSNVGLRDLARWIRENHQSDPEKS